MTNQTTHEIFRKNKIHYMEKFKELKKRRMENLNINIPGTLPFHPFDMGIIQNWKFVLQYSKQL